MKHCIDCGQDAQAILCNLCVDFQTDPDIKEYRYHINLDERGMFYADVRDRNDETVYEIKSDFDGIIWQIEDGFMRDKNDIEGLEIYLKEIDILPYEGILEAA